IEAGADEKRPVLVLLQERDGLGGYLAVGVLLVTGRRRLEPEGAAAPAAWRVIREQPLFVLVDPARVDHLVPRRRIVEAARADVARIAVVVNLADTRREVAVLLEQLWQRDNVRTDLSELRRQVVDANRVGPQAAPEGARR